jgi:putative intracellular protease/amidase
VPIDPESLMLQEVGHVVGLEGKVHRRYEGRAFMDRLVTTMKAADADPAGYGVCHGPAGLLEVRLSGGEYLISGKDVTGFSWREEELAKREKAVPYNLEEELKRRGAKYSTSSVPFKSYVVEDGLLITGQNPASASGVGEAVVKRLKAGG